MSQETALKFIDALRNDPALRTKLTQLHPDDIAGVVDLAGMAGYDFSEQDYRAAIETFKSRETVGGQGGLGPLSRIPGFNR